MQINDNPTCTLINFVMAGHVYGYYVQVLRLVECSINTILTTASGYLVIGCADGAVRFYDFFLRLEAWFEDLAAGAVTSVSFSLQNCPYEEGEAGGPGLKFWCPDFVVGTTDAFILGVESKLFDEVLAENRRGTLLLQVIYSSFSFSFRFNLSFNSLIFGRVCPGTSCNSDATRANRY